MTVDKFFTVVFNASLVAFLLTLITGLGMTFLVAQIAAPLRLVLGDTIVPLALGVEIGRRHQSAAQPHEPADSKAVPSEAPATGAAISPHQG